MKKIAIIPARGGSKRIPRKNIRPFLGKPIIAYSIEAALQSGLFDEVMVSTDDQEIADVARAYGAKVPFMRSAANANDFATTAAVIEEVIGVYHKMGFFFNYSCCIYPTAPLVSASRLAEAFGLMQAKNFHSVLPVVSFSYPIWRSLQVTEGRATMLWPEHRDSRSQDLPPAFHDAGQFYWLNLSHFAAAPVLFSDNTGVVILPETEVQDIDTLSDWQLAELKYTINQQAHDAESSSV